MTDLTFGTSSVREEKRWLRLAEWQLALPLSLAFVALFLAPLLLLVAVGDHLVPSELAIAAFDTAHQPKELIIMPGGHFDAYTVGFEASRGPARDWFLRHLDG